MRGFHRVPNKCHRFCSGLLSSFTRTQSLFAMSDRKPIPAPEAHDVLKNSGPLDAEFPGMERAMFGMGCFWGAERKFWQAEGVVSTAVGYAGGHAGWPHPTYREVCSGGQTGHAEVVRVIWNPKETSFRNMLHVFWKNHNPTQLNRQGNDRGTQYRTCIFYYNEEQKKEAELTRDLFNQALKKANKGEIVTQIQPAKENPFFFAEEYHQQYLSKNPGGYCGLGGTGCYDPDTVDNELASVLETSKI